MPLDLWCALLHLSIITSYPYVYSSVCSRMQTQTNFIQLTTYCIVLYCMCVKIKVPLLKLSSTDVLKRFGPAFLMPFPLLMSPLGAKWKSTGSAGGWQFSLYSETHSGKTCIYQHSYKELISFTHMRSSK